MAVCSAILATSLVERRLVYSTTCSVTVLYAVVRLVMAAQSSAVACARLVNTTGISMALFAALVWYPPRQEVGWSYRRFAYDLMIC